MDELQIFKESSMGLGHRISDNIIIRSPTLEEICDFGEQKYYAMISSLTSSASDYKVVLWDTMGIDWTTISDWQFFVLMCKNFTREQTSILLGDLDLSKLSTAFNNQTNEEVLVQEYNENLEIVIDRAIYTELTDYIRKMHGFEKRVDKPADEHTKKYMIDKERRRVTRHKNDPLKSILKPLIGSMVNYYGFDYNYSTVWNLPISAFNESVSRIQKYINYTQTMHGIYSGCIDMKKGNINMEELNWLG